MTSFDAEATAIATPQQYRALGHPVRHRLLFALGQAATLSRLAADLGISKGSAAYHLKVLRQAGLVRLERTRQVRGGTEQYFKRTAQRMKYEDGDATKALFAAVTDEFLTDGSDPLLLVRSVRLSSAQAERLRLAMEEIVHGQEDEEDGSRHVVMVGLYRPRQAGE